MPTSDRAFRALARAEPEIILALLDALAPGVLPRDATVTPEHVDDSRLDASPYLLDADWLARVGADDVAHVECQGYRDGAFPDRTFRYHLASVLRYPDRRVTTFTLWLIVPPASQRVDVIERGNVRITIHSLVLPEAPAARLLADTRTACFAPGAHAGEMTAEELCRAAARQMRRGQASPNQKRMALVVATIRGRYDAMMTAMRTEDFEPFFDEDLRKFFEDRAIAQTLRGTILDVLDARGLAISAEERARLAEETSIERLRLWHRRAATVAGTADVFAADSLVDDWPGLA